MDETKFQAGDVPDPSGLPEGVVISPDTLRKQRLPPGQARTRKWPVLDASGPPPPIDLARWTFRIEGRVRRPAAWTWTELQALPRVRVFSDFHCVTRWSRLGNLWEGISARLLLEHVEPLPDARYVLAHALDGGWTTNLPLAALLGEDALVADTHDGEPITREHGGPLRLVVPRLYAWKSAKWVAGLELLARDEPGYWERGGYHMNGDPWREERFRDD
jgi:DMSO/TMAO reductase YedYZ molybdopterin-dependent catalytic subunit